MHGEEGSQEEGREETSGQEESGQTQGREEGCTYPESLYQETGEEEAGREKEASLAEAESCVATLREIEGEIAGVQKKLHVEVEQFFKDMQDILAEIQQIRSEC